MVAIALMFAVPASATPLAVAGDSGLRHDIELLADAGILKGPVLTWPLAWPQVDADLGQLDDDTNLSPAIAGALARVRARLNRKKRLSHARSGAYIRGGTDPQFLRTFDDTPRAQAVTGAFADWTGERFAGRLELSYAADPADDKEVRLDGTWGGAMLGNWMLAAGFLDRYWGPAWQGGLIISNNARPRPGVTLRRLRTTPFETKWLSWIGPWNLTVFTERLESDRGVPNALLYGLRFAFRPFESLQIGLSRSSQFGGDGRNVGFDTIANVITGKTTSTSPIVGSSEGINSLGGGDIRWKLPYINSAVYTELIGEDEKGSRPDLILAQGGIEFWGGIGTNGASWRLVYEYTDTKADAFDSSEREGAAEFGIAYNNGDFPTGYRYRGRAIGYPADGDALLHSVRAMAVTAAGSEFRVIATTGELNRGADQRPEIAARNSLTQRKEDVDALDLGYSTQTRWARVDLGLGYTRRDFDSGSSGDVHAWIGLSREFD